MIRTITREVLKHKLERYERLTFVDTRPLDEFENGHIRDAVHLPLEHLEERAKKILTNTGASLIVYDQDGGVRSRAAARKLIELGYPEVFVLMGGESEWAHEGEGVQWHVNPAPGMGNPSYPMVVL